MTLSFPRQLQPAVMLPATRTYYGLFALFSVYGPSLSVVGELRYVEVALLLMLLLNLHRAVRAMGPWERRLVALFLLAAFSQLISDLVNESEMSGTVRRVGTYVILAALVVTMKWLGRGDLVRMRWILAGYCLSYVFILFVGASAIPDYQEVPWRLGLGMAATLFACVAIASLPRLAYLAPFGLLSLAGLHIVLEARSLAAITALTGLQSLWTWFRPKSVPGRSRPVALALFPLLAAAGVVAMYFGAIAATEHKLWPEQVQAKMEAQLASPYGLLGAGRPDTVAAMYAITKRPILGFGSTGFDQEVHDFYAALAASSYISTSIYGGVYQGILAEERSGGIPSHSHLLSAWVDGGLPAAFCWLAVLGLIAYVLSRVISWRHRATPLIVFVGLLTIWDVLFSPGPHRMDMALRLMVLIYAAELLRAFDLRVAGLPTRSLQQQLRTRPRADSQSAQVSLTTEGRSL